MAPRLFFEINDLFVRRGDVSPDEIAFRACSTTIQPVATEREIQGLPHHPKEDSMKFVTRWLITGALVGVCVLAWGSNVGRDVVGAQGSSKPTVIKRIYTGTDGLSHVEDIVLDAKSVMEKVASVEVRVGQPGRFSDWHVGPQRQYIINLSGNGQLEVAEGKVDLPPGSMEYIDDLTGKGHTTRITSKEERVSIWLKFEDQKQRIGPLKSN